MKIIGKILKKNLIKKMDNEIKTRLHSVIPGGAHTYSRGDDQFPDNAPPLLSRGKGSYVWCSNDKQYLDFGMGLRSVNIGYGNEEIADAVYKDILDGNNLTRASTTELEAAELIVDLIDSAEMVKFAKHGSTVTTAAIKLARAFTGRKFVAIPKQHPFFSFDDWFIGSTVMNKGSLNETSNFTLTFDYNDISSLDKLYDKYPNQIAAVILEPSTSIGPCTCGNIGVKLCSKCPENKKNFLHQVRELTKKNYSLMILDEMITGFRYDLKGAQNYFDVIPDLSTFGKAIANGFSVAALTGKKEIMELGSIKNDGEERVFLTSTTHGAEMSSLRAFIKTVEIMRRESVIDHFWGYGKKLKSLFNEMSTKYDLINYFKMEGYDCSPNLYIKDFEKEKLLSNRTLFLQEMIENKVLMPYIALSYSHKSEELEITKRALEETFFVIKQSQEKGVDQFLNSKIIKPVFRKYN